MSGFAPRGYFRFAEIREIMGIDEFGGWLAAGDMIAHVLDDAGNVVPIDARVWRTAEAAEIMSTGALTPADGSPAFPLYVASQEPSHLVRIMAARKAKAAPITLVSGQPAWWPASEETVSAWSTRAASTSEAERRIKAAGVPLSEGRVCAALEVMWREAGQEVSEGTIARLRRRA